MMNYRIYYPNPDVNDGVPPVAYWGHLNKELLNSKGNIVRQYLYKDFETMQEALNYFGKEHEE